ncbi:MAG: tagatose-6-phosphate ketose isomerase [Acidobacteriota bacterium]
MSRLLNLIHLSQEEKAKRGLIHTPSEIVQQPHTWATTFMNFQQRCPEIQGFLQSKGIGPAASTTHPRPIVFLIGAGTSDYIGQSLIALLRQKWQCEVNAIPSTDLLTNFDDFILRDARYLWISFSRSGDSPEGVNVLNKALKEYPQISHLVVSCNAQGKMIRDHQNDPRVFGLLLDDAVNDRGLAMTSSYSNMVVCGQCLAHTWTLEEYEPILHSLIAAGERFLEVASECAANLAEGPYTRVCFVGSGSLKAVSTESALKVSELTAGRIQSMSESTLGLRHGPLAALNAETLFVSFISSDSRRKRYEADLLHEIGEKGVVQTRVAVAIQPSSEVEKECEYFLTPGLQVSIPDPYRPPLDVIFGQSLGLFFSIHCNLKPDAPSPSGAITRVVQNVPIH